LVVTAAKAQRKLFVGKARRLPIARMATSAQVRN
jgi:hypothetical protein